MVGTDGLAAELERHLALHRAQLADYLEIERTDFPAENADGENRLQHAVLRAGIGLEAFWAEWLAETLDALPSDERSSSRSG